MLTHQQILQFRTFGYLTLPALFAPEEAATLRAEVTGALADAFGPVRAEPRGRGGISGDYLPLASERAPFTLSLIADDRRTFGVSAELLGVPTVPSIGVATRFLGDSTWHTRQGPDVGGVTFWADLEPRTAQTGALRVIPGSHLPEFEQRLSEYCGAEPATSGFESWEWPHVVVETSPGDVVVMHEHLRQCAAGATPRLSWTISYFPWPGLARPDELAAVAAMVADDVEFDHEDYDRDRWPVWSDWAAGVDASPSRATAVERLALLGILEDASRG